MTVPVFRAHVEEGRIVADGAAGRPAGASVIVAELFTAFGHDADRTRDSDGAAPEG